MKWQGFAIGFLGLTLLDVVLSSSTASSHLGGLAAGFGNVAEKFLSPTVPIFGTSNSPSPSSPSPSPTPPASSTPPPSSVNPNASLAPYVQNF